MALTGTAFAVIGRHSIFDDTDRALSIMRNRENAEVQADSFRAYNLLQRVGVTAVYEGVRVVEIRWAEVIEPPVLAVSDGPAYLDHQPLI